MPPPIQQTGSKAGLISWTIIATILMLVAVVLAFIANADAGKTRHELDSTTAKLKELVQDTELNSATINALRTAKDADTSNELPKGSDTKLLDFAVAQRDLAAKRLGGSPDLNQALLAYQSAATGANTAVGSDVSSGGAVSTINALVSTINTKTAEIQKLSEQLADVRKQQKAALDAHTSAAKEFASGLAAASKQITDVTTAAGTDRSQKDVVVTDANKQMQDAQAAQAAAIADSTAKIAALTKEVATAKQQVAAVRAQMERFRQNVNDPIIAHADARITKIGSDDTVYIDLGQGDHLAPGTSFEVYDRFEGVPKLRGDVLVDENLPKGKASIEVTHVMPGLAEARVVRRARGTTITEGDFVSNLVYDKNIPFKFYVYGNFDLDRNKSATPQDADVIRRLITQWGGQVSDKLDISVDFVVIGAVPEVPSFTQEELDQPDIRKRKDDAEAALRTYQDIVNHAIELHIPILNQNRFLYYTGYYEQSAR